MIWRVLLPALLVAIVPASAQAPETYVESVDVRLVVVDVLVTDAAGGAVLDLGAEDFAVTEDGEPVTLSQFTPPAAEAAGRAVPAVAEGAERPAMGRERMSGGSERLVVFIDGLHLGPASRRRALETVWEVLDRRLAPEDEVMVASFDGTVEVLLPMSRDRRALHKLLHDQGRYGVQAVTLGLGEDRALQLVESRHQEASTQGQSRRSDQCVDLGFIARTHAEQVRASVEQTVSALREFVDSLGHFQGRKTLLYVSDGVPLVAGEEVYRFAMELCDGTAAAKGLSNGVDTAMLGSGRFTRWDPRAATTELEEFNTAPLWERLAAHANTYQVSIYSLQAKGPHLNRSGTVDGARTSFETEMAGRRNAQDPLYMLAGETGGRAILDRSDFAGPLEQMIDDSAHRYQLAYEPPSPGDGGEHRIRVAVSRPDVKLLYRRSYTDKDPRQRMVDGVLSTLYHGGGDNPLGARLAVAETVAGERGTVATRMAVRLPLARLVMLPDGETARGLFTVFVAARDEAGRVTPVGSKTVPVRVRADGVGEQDFTYVVELPLRAGLEHDVVVGLRDEIGGEESFLRRTVRAGGEG